MIHWDLKSKAAKESNKLLTYWKWTWKHYKIKLRDLTKKKLPIPKSVKQLLRNWLSPNYNLNSQMMTFTAWNHTSMNFNRICKNCLNKKLLWKTSSTCSKNKLNSARDRALSNWESLIILKGNCNPLGIFFILFKEIIKACLLIHRPCLHYEESFNVQRRKVLLRQRDDFGIRKWNEKELAWNWLTFSWGNQRSYRQWAQITWKLLEEAWKGVWMKGKHKKASKNYKILIWKLLI